MTLIFLMKRIFYVTIPIFAVTFYVYFNVHLLHKIRAAANYEPKSAKITYQQECQFGGKVILFWTKFFEADDFYVGFGNKTFRECSVCTCCTTNNRALLDQSAAIIFHIRDLDLEDLPPYRHPHQRWIFFLLESPINTPSILMNLNNLFNWTMTYRTDSDIYAPYPVLETGDEVQDLEVETNKSKNEELSSLVRSKTKKVAWFVSNCDTSSGREKFAKELEKYIDVDVYGKCGTLKCVDRLPCYRMIERDYKFYLAFENSLCHDYVTEKFYNALLFNTVPIVYGGANYEAIAPLGSFINVNRFSSVQGLADYLGFLDRNEEEYLRYFEWRNTSKGLASLPRTHDNWCTLCSMLHNDSLPVHFYSNIHSWWFEGQCKEIS